MRRPYRKHQRFHRQHHGHGRHLGQRGSVQLGQQVHLDITSLNFTSGTKTITATGANTISWTEAGAAVTEGGIYGGM